MTLCPLVYSGKGGVCNNGRQLSSIYRLIYVSGLITLLLYFSSQQLIKASNKVMAVKVYAAEVSIKLSFFLAAMIPIIDIQCPPGEIFFVANIRCPEVFKANGLQSQKLAISFCSPVNCLPA